MGIAQTAAGISRLIAPVSSTALFEHIGRASPFFFAAAMVGAGSLLSTRLRPERAAAAESAPEQANP
jgi:hypothetical protein